MDTRPDWNNKALGAQVGVSGQTVGTWLAGTSRPDGENLLQLAVVTGEEPWFLFSLVYDIPLPGANTSEGKVASDALDLLLQTFDEEERSTMLTVGMAIRRARKKGT